MKREVVQRERGCKWEGMVVVEEVTDGVPVRGVVRSRWLSTGHEG